MAARQPSDDQSKPRAYYLKLTFDEDSMSNVLSGSLSEADDSDPGQYEDVTGSNGDNNSSSSASAYTPWLLGGWNHITEPEAFGEVINRVKSSTAAASADVDENIEFVNEIFELRVSCADNPDADSEKGAEPQKSHFLNHDEGSTDGGSGAGGSKRGDQMQTSIIPPYIPVFKSSFRKPNLGPFITALFTKLEVMPGNSLYVNLHLTRLIARLACYPQPLIASFLLNPNLVFQPSVRSLFQILSSVRHKVDTWASKVEGWDALMVRGRKFLISREKKDHASKKETTDKRRTSRWDTEAKPQAAPPAPVKKDRSFSIFGNQVTILNTPSHSPLTRKLSKTRAATVTETSITTKVNKPDPSPPDDNFPVPNSDSALNVMKTKNVVYCAIVLEEFLKELSAIAQEQSVVQPELSTSEFLRRT